MRQLWSADELGERWTLLPEDLALLAGLTDTGKLGLATQLTYWRRHGRFPDDETNLDREYGRDQNRAAASFSCSTAWSWISARARSWACSVARARASRRCCG